LRIAEGDLSHRVNIKGGDEIEELGDSFNRMTEQLERMIIGGKELTANISHELRTPLTRIRIAVEILRDKLERGDFGKWENHLDDITEDIGALDCLIGRILELSKIDIHELRLNMERLDLPEFLNELIDKLKPIIKLKNLNVKKNFSFSSPMMGDKNSLGIAFLNVLDNAVKFTPEKGNILLKTYSEDSFIGISVANSYRRLAEQEIEKIFEPFYRAERSNASGSGLGLAITKKIIEKHGGAIEALNSTEGFEIIMKFPREREDN
jgi:two-component system sensor histidine kinase CpxA